MVSTVQRSVLRRVDQREEMVDFLGSELFQGQSTRFVFPAKYILVILLEQVF